jgi:hypothetical protein
MANQADLDALNAAIASGEKQVALGAQQVTYRSIAELMVARDDIQRQLDAPTTGTKSRITKLYQAGRST